VFDDFVYGRHKYVVLKLKPLEWGKPKKFGRIICDLGTPASLRAGILFDAMKKSMASIPLCSCGGPQHLPSGSTDFTLPVSPCSCGFTCYFVPEPNVDSLSHFFNLMTTNSVALVFSDDMAISVGYLDEHGEKRMMYFEVDISGCDASQGPAVWRMARACVPQGLHLLFDNIVSQALKPCKAGHGREKLLFKPLIPREYSGIVATTVLNNCASFTIAHQLLSSFPLLDERECREEVERRLETVGWKCTLVACPVLERLTFLKHSPVYTVTGEIVACMNLGVILRALGQKSYDLPGRGCLYKRALAFNAALVSGFRHAGNTSLLRLLQSKFPSRGEVVFNSNIASRVVSSGLHPEIDESSLMRR